MPKYDLREPLEGLGRGNERFDDYEDLHIHHPGTNAEAVRTGNAGRVDSDAGIVNGELEAIRREDGNVLVKKDIVFLDQNGSANVQIPAPIQGYVHYLSPNTYGSVRIYDKPFGTPGAELVGQVLHLDRSSFTIPEGGFVQYGQPIGRQAGTGPNGINHFGTHAHIELEAPQFERYINDLKTGVITQETFPARGSPGAQPAPSTPSANALADGVLREGETGPEVKRLQEQLAGLGFKGRDGRALAPDSDFGDNTKFAVEAYQRSRGLGVDGVVGDETFKALRANKPAIGTGAPSPSPTTPPTAPATGQQPSTGGANTSVLSNLIGSGEGDYNSYNRGRAGDSNNRPLNLTDMTVGEIMRRQRLPANDPNFLFAVGKFQMVGPGVSGRAPDTFGETVRALKIDPNAKFTPELQEKMFANYLIDGKRPAINDYITGKTSGAAGLEKAQHALALEFASVGDPRNGGRGAYDGDSAGNSASISVRESAAALDKMREQYQANIAKGMSPQAAYDGLRNIGPGQTTGTTPPAQNNPLSDGLLMQGDKGTAVKQLQEQLNRLGFKGQDGKPLTPDSDFGGNTKFAVEAFQRSKGLEPDGKVGRDTFAALKAADVPKTSTPTPTAGTQSTLLSDPKHTDNKIFVQAMSALERLPAGTFKSAQEMQNAAGAITSGALISGMSKIDEVKISTNGTSFIATQKDQFDRYPVDRAAAVGQSLERSTQLLNQEKPAITAAAPTVENESVKKSAPQHYV